MLKLKWVVGNIMANRRPCSSKFFFCFVLYKISRLISDLGLVSHLFRPICSVRRLRGRGGAFRPALQIARADSTCAAVFVAAAAAGARHRAELFYLF